MAEANIRKAFRETADWINCLCISAKFVGVFIVVVNGIGLDYKSTKNMEIFYL
jgi:hypothetical protein